MNKQPADLLEEWRDAARAHFAKDPEHPVGQAFERCANELELALKNSRPRVAATALLAGAIVLSEPLFEGHDWHAATTYTLVPPHQFPIEAPMIPADHTHEERGGENLLFTVSAPAASGANVAAGVNHIKMDVADDLRS